MALQPFLSWGNRGEIGNQISVTDANQHTTTYVPDKLGRRIQVIYHDQNTESTESTHYDFLGRVDYKIDQAGKETDYGYDLDGRLKSVTQYLNGNPLVTSYGYDEVGNRISQTDATLLHTTLYAYDDLGRRTSRTLPMGQTESYFYDVFGNLTSKKDFNGHTTTYDYDENNRLASKMADPFFSTGSCSGGACGATSIGFTYTPTGKRKTMADATGTTTYNYDAVTDLLTSKQTPFGTLTYIYDEVGNLTSIASSNGNGASMAYTYDPDNRLKTVSDISGSNVTSYAHDDAGNLQSFAYPNGVSHSYTYDTLNRLTNLSVSCGTNAPNCGPGGSSNAFGYAYTLGLSGNRTSVTELSGRTVQYGYDDLYRLTSETIAGAASQNGTIGYTYDAVGNRQQITSTVAAIPGSGILNYDANDRTATDTWDNDGNMTASGDNVYDFENHLVRSGLVTIIYDGDGNRVSETAGGITTKYLVDTQNPTGYAQVVEELQRGSVVRKYSYGLERISENQLISGTWKISFYGYDGHGSVRALTNNTGAVTDSYDYDAFGNLLNSAGTTPNSYLFAGESYDFALGMYYNRARYYSPTNGRFFSMDSDEGEDERPTSLHKYLYAEGNPVDSVDPSGNEIDEVVGAFSVGATINAMSTIQFNAIIGSATDAPDIHQLIADKAHSYWHSTRWKEWRGSPLNCNLYVFDVLHEVGVSVPTFVRQPGTVRMTLMKVGLAKLAQTPPLAQEWGDPSFYLPDWRILEGGPDAARPGDVIAQKNANGGGHVGIVIGNQLTSSASSIAKPAGLVVENNWGFRMPKKPGDWEEGLKQNCIVRRFTGDPNHPDKD